MFQLESCAATFQFNKLNGIRFSSKSVGAKYLVRATESKDSAGVRNGGKIFTVIGQTDNTPQPPTTQHYVLLCTGSYSYNVHNSDNDDTKHYPYRYPNAHITTPNHRDTVSY